MGLLDHRKGGKDAGRAQPGDPPEIRTAEPPADTGSVDLVDREAEIVPGISAIAAPGHTPGLMALAISSKKEQLLCISDVVLHPVHLEHPEWCSMFDVVPKSVGVTRRNLLDRAAAEKALVIAFHFPFPGAGPCGTEKKGMAVAAC